MENSSIIVAVGLFIICGRSACFALRAMHIVQVYTAPLPLGIGTRIAERDKLF
jgi:hypothetical protein